MVIVETSIFTREVERLLSDEEYRGLQVALLSRPDSGAIIRGSGGLRKIRWGGSGRGKRGGTRIIYYWAARQDRILMLLVYPKSERDDLTANQLKILRSIVEGEYP